MVLSWLYVVSDGWWGYKNHHCAILDGDTLTLKCAKCGKDTVIGEVSIQRRRTHIKLYFCSNKCAGELTRALPAAVKK